MPTIKEKKQLKAQTPIENFTLDYPNEAIGQSRIVLADCLNWLSKIPDESIHGIVTDPPYGLTEFDADQLAKRKNGKGGIWRLPPAFDGATRSPLPRFTALNERERKRLSDFFTTWSLSLVRTLRTGGHVFIATNSFMSQLVYSSLIAGGLPTIFSFRPLGNTAKTLVGNRLFLHLAPDSKGENIFMSN